MKKEVVLKIINDAKKIMISLDPETIEELEMEIEIILKHFDRVKKINTKNVEPMFFVDETPIENIRNGNEIENIDREIILKNAPSKKNNFITITKVVSND
ncbi:MAG: hypothetical protein K4H23_03220 [Mollicutes bacterium PWAP]|nr:hypothetical protein [Mollicutes bacterium PWAP]